jgi:hypothetical protein
MVVFNDSWPARWVVARLETLPSPGGNQELFGRSARRPHSRQQVSENARRHALVVGIRRRNQNNARSEQRD